MDLASLTVAAEATRALFGLAKGAASAVVDHQLKDKLIEIQQGILDVQSKLGDAQAERMDLLHEVGELRDKLRAAETAKAALDGYVMHEIEPGFKVYRAKPEAGHAMDHYACPRCYHGGGIGVLQSTVQMNAQTRWTCSVCSFTALTGRQRPMPRFGDTDEWRYR